MSASRMTLSLACLMYIAAPWSTLAQTVAPPPELTTFSLCTTDTPENASACKDKVLKSLVAQVGIYSAQLATFEIEVNVPSALLKGKDPSGPQVAPFSNRGTGFLVNRERGFFVSSKHVLLGDRVWDFTSLDRQDFVDFETAAEDLLSSKAVVIRARPSIFQPGEGINLQLVAFDRSTDLVLLQASSMTQLYFNGQSVFQAILLAPRAGCEKMMWVSAMGYPTNDPRNQLRASNWTQVSDCLVTPQTANIGGRRYRFALNRSTRLSLAPG